MVEQTQRNLQTTFPTTEGKPFAPAPLKGRQQLLLEQQDIGKTHEGVTYSDRFAMRIIDQLYIGFAARGKLAEAAPSLQILMELASGKES